MNTFQQLSQEPPLRLQQYRIEWVVYETGQIGHGDWTTSKEDVIQWVDLCNKVWKDSAHHIYVPRWYGGLCYKPAK